MFALDLFNTQYERELREGAVDNLEARRIDDLNAKMQDLLARAQNANPEMKAGLKREFDKIKAERDSYFKVRNETMGYGTLVGEELSGDELSQRMAQLSKDADASIRQSIDRQSDARIAALKNPPKSKSFMQQVGDKQIGMVKGAWKGLTGSVEEAGIGQDLVTPQQRVKQSQPQKQTPAGKVVDTAKQAAKWLAGKGGPGKEGPTYEATAPATAPRAFGVGNFQRLVKANMGNRPYVDLEFANPADNLKLDQAGLDLISDYYDGLETDQAKNHFIYRVLPSADEVKTILTKLGWTGAGQQQLPLAEKKKFNNGSDLEAGDVKVARELQKLRAQYPAAKSDVEAVAKAELDGTERSQQQLAAIKGANEKQDALLKQLVSLDQEQGRELDDLDQENNTLEKRLARVQATNDRLQQTVSQIAATKKVDSKSDQTKTDAINKTNQDDEEDDVEPAIDLIPDAPVDNTPAPKVKPKSAPKKVYRKRKEKTSPGLGHMAQQIAGFPKVAPGKVTEPEKDITEPEKTVNQAPSEPEDDVVQPPGRLKSLRPKVATNADDFKLVAEHGGGIGPRQHWQDLMQENKLSVGDPIVVTAPNEFEGKTGEIYEFSPSGTFVIVDLYNHGKHSMHLSDIEFNQYAANQEDEDDWYDDGAEDTLEGWSNKMVAQRTGQAPTPYSVYIQGKEWKSFPDDDHAENVANKLRAKFKAEGRDPSVITIAPTGYDKKSVNELDATTLKSYADKRGAQVAAMKADNPDAVAGSPAWIKQAVPAQKIARATQKIARKERQQGVTEDTGSWIVYDPKTKQIKKRFKTHTAGKSYAKTHALGFASSEYYFDNVKEKTVDEAIVASGPSKPLDDRAVRKMVWDTMKINADTGEQALQRALSVLAKKPQSRMVQDLQDKFQNLADRLAQGVLEGQTDYQKRRQRERDIDAGRPVKPLPKNPQTDYAKKRAKDRKDMELGEGLMKDPTNRKEYLDQRDKLFRMMSMESNPANKQIIKQAIKELERRFGSTTNIREESGTDSDAVERAILNRIMVAHTDLLMKFGPEKVMQAAEEVAYNVGDVDEIGTSDVSAYVAQVKQILGVPMELDEKWSQKYKSSINCASPKGFSQRAHCAGKKK